MKRTKDGIENANFCIINTKTNPQNWRESRRLQALKLKSKGWKQNKIAEAPGVSAGAVCQWLKRVSEQGPETLHHTPPPGKPAASLKLRKNNWLYCSGRVAY